MPFFIFEIARDSALEVLVRTFPDAPLAEAGVYRVGAAQLRELRRAEPPGGALYYLVYGEDEGAARARLRASR